MSNSQPIQTNFIKTLISLRDWASDSYYYVNRRNHLPRNEKIDARNRLCVYESYLKKLIEFHSPDSCDADTQYILKGQAKMNQIAQLYEFPPYHLPETIQVTQDQSLYLLEVTNDTLKDFVGKGDQLLTKRVYSLADLKPFDLVSVIYRLNYRTPRKTKVGWFDSLSGNTLILRYDVPDLVQPRPIWGISMYNVVHVHKVVSVNHNWE